MLVHCALCLSWGGHCKTEASGEIKKRHKNTCFIGWQKKLRGLLVDVAYKNEWNKVQKVPNQLEHNTNNFCWTICPRKNEIQSIKATCPRELCRSTFIDWGPLVSTSLRRPGPVGLLVPTPDSSGPTPPGGGSETPWQVRRAAPWTHFSEPRLGLRS